MSERKPWGDRCILSPGASPCDAQDSGEGAHFVWAFVWSSVNGKGPPWRHVTDAAQGPTQHRLLSVAVPENAWQTVKGHAHMKGSSSSSVKHGGTARSGG